MTLRSVLRPPWLVPSRPGGGGGGMGDDEWVASGEIFPDICLIKLVERRCI